MTTPQQPRTDAAPIDGSEAADLEQIQANIEQTREELGETVEALTSKLDVRSRAKSKITDVQNQAIGTLHTGRARVFQLTQSARRSTTDEHGEPTPVVIAAAAGVAAVLVSVLVAGWRRRRSTTPVLDRVRRR